MARRSKKVNCPKLGKRSCKKSKKCSYVGPKTCERKGSDALLNAQIKRQETIMKQYGGDALNAEIANLKAWYLSKITETEEKMKKLEDRKVKRDAAKRQKLLKKEADLNVKIERLRQERVKTDNPHPFSSI